MNELLKAILDSDVLNPRRAGRRAAKERPAHRELVEAGSIMARPQPPAWRRNLSPLPATALDLVDALTSFVDPLDASGSGKAQIPLQAWRKMAPQAKAMVTRMANKEPELFAKVLASPRKFFAVVRQPRSKEALGQTVHSRAPKNPEWSTVQIRPDQVRTSVPMHEFQHPLNRARVAATDPQDAATIGMLLSSLMPKRGPIGQASIGRVLDQRRKYQGALDVLKKDVVIPTDYGSMPAMDYLNRELMDEALSYLRQHGASRQADPILRELASKILH